MHRHDGVSVKPRLTGRRGSESRRNDSDGNGHKRAGPTGDQELRYGHEQPRRSLLDTGAAVCPGCLFAPSYSTDQAHGVNAHHSQQLPTSHQCPHAERKEKPFKPHKLAPQWSVGCWAGAVGGCGTVGCVLSMSPGISVSNTDKEGRGSPQCSAVLGFREQLVGGTKNTVAP